MTAAVHNIVIEQGVPFVFPLVYLNPDRVTPIDLTGYSAKMQVRFQFASDVPLLDMSTSNGKIILGGALGTITADASDLETALLEGRQAVYDLLLIQPDGTPIRLLKGQVTISPRVTRDGV